jgi:hypothetical protein
MTFLSYISHSLFMMMVSSMVSGFSLVLVNVFGLLLSIGISHALYL